MIVPCTINLWDKNGPQFDNRTWLSWSFDREHSFNDCKQTAFSHMLVCPACHHIWAKIQIEKDKVCWPKAQFCEFCDISDSWHPVPGSLLINEGLDTIDDSLLEALPPDLLMREYNLTMKAFDNGNLNSHSDYPTAITTPRNQHIS